MITLLHSDSDSDQDFASVVATLDEETLKDIAFASRFRSEEHASAMSCSVSPPPRIGSYNIVYEVIFSDSIKYAIRIPGEPLSPARARAMELDIQTQNYIALHTSLPVPLIHRWSSTCDNPLSRPFVVMDFMPGTNLSKVWHDKTWMTAEKRTRIFDQLATWMTELSNLNFDRIGKLNIDEATGTCRIVAFPDSESLVGPGAIVSSDTEDTSPTSSRDSDPSPAGPFSSTHAFLSYKLSMRRQISDSPMLALLQLFLLSLPDPCLDGPPFALRPPDFEYQNVLVADDGTITGLIDWDGVMVGPRQGGAAAYPSWLTTDWDPVFYGWNEANTPEENADCDSPDHLAKFRRMYVHAIEKASQGRLTDVTRNSHVFEALNIAVSNCVATSGVVDHLSKFVFGSGLLGWEVEEGMKSAAWFGMKVGDMAYLPSSSDTVSASDYE